MDGHLRANFGKESVASLWFSIEILPGFCELVEQEYLECIYMYIVSCIIKNIIMVESLFSLEKGVRR